MENNINELNNRNGELTVEKIREIIRNFFIFHNGREFDSSLLYRLENGAKLYDEICSDENYPYIGIEIDCLKELHSDPTFIKELKKVKNITDHRAGNGDKGVELLRETGWEGTYHATDCTQDMLKLAESRINRAIENVPGMERVKLGDFSKVNSKELLVKNLEDHMYLFLGGSICNMSDWEIQEELEKMGNNSFING